MKILALSDIYGNTDLISELHKKYSNIYFDIVIVAGGISNIKKDNSYNILKSLAGIGERILFVPGGNDQKQMNFSENNIINLDKSYVVIEKDELKVGFIGLGGVPERSIKREKDYPYRWNETICRNDFMRNLKTNYQKLRLEKVDYVILVSHSPPYHIADYSRKITLNEFETTMEAANQDLEDKKRTANSLFLGSKILRDFTKDNKIHLHIFGHVHKQGGKRVVEGNTIFLNVSHLSQLPYKLTGRKVCIIELSKKIKIEFQSIVNDKLEFEEFLHSYI